MRAHKPDTLLLVLTIALTISGFFIFTSASLSLLARPGASFWSVASSQILFGIIGGSLALYVMSSIHYRFWRKYAFYIFLLSLILTALVFIPGLGLEIGGAKRWLVIAGFSFQPAEFLKIGFIIYAATWLSGMQQHIKEPFRGAFSFFAIVGLVGGLMLMQPDTDTFFIMAAAATAMFLAAGGRWRDVGLVIIAGLILLIMLAFMRPYIMDRLMTFIHPGDDPQGISYQVQQSLIAIGTGGAFGRGFGQSVQKFDYLPEPIGDSIFAVFAEEFGFLGTTVLILLLSAFTFRGFRIASHSKDQFGMLLVVGFMCLITFQAFLNIAAMLAVVPLGGLPLPFISHGGTALLATLASVGIVLNVSKYQQKR